LTFVKPDLHGEALAAPSTGEGFCCPYCSGPLVPLGVGLQCETEGRAFASTGGVYRLLEEARSTALRPFLELEHRRRRDEGYDATPGLPEPPAGHRLAAQWRARARNLREGLRLTGEALGPGPWRVLEVGAGCAWAGAVLAVAGHRVTAIDASLDPGDGLFAAARLRAPGSSLELAEADMEALPLEAGRFDLVLAVDALHYAREIQRALVELRRVTRRGGALLVLESPVYARREDGEADVARRMRRLQRLYRVEPPRETQAGYLVWPELPALFGQAGYRLDKGAPPFAGWARVVDLVAVLLGRGGLPARPVLLARRDG
jgi:SAM-dependent methyltransferase